LSEAEIATLTEWVRRGAPDPRVLAKSAGAQDWCLLKPLVKPEVPWKNPGHPIDAFVYAQTAREATHPVPRGGPPHAHPPGHVRPARATADTRGALLTPEVKEIVAGWERSLADKSPRWQTLRPKSATSTSGEAVEAR